MITVLGWMFVGYLAISIVTVIGLFLTSLHRDREAFCMSLFMGFAWVGAALALVTYPKEFK